MRTGANTGLDVVTGAFSYTGRFIAGQLLASGRRVRTLTGHPNRPHPFGDRVEVRPYAFDEPANVARSLEGVATLFNTYWVRFERGRTTFESAVRNSRVLFEAAREAGARRIVHVSVTNPSIDSPLPYFRGKALVEQALAEAGVPYAIVRPSLVFGPGDILINNIAWLLRRLPVFAIPGSGAYRVRPVHVEDVAQICVESAASDAQLLVDAVGPEVLTYAEMTRLIRDAVGSRARLVHVPPALAVPAGRLIGLGLGDVLLTPGELAGLMAELITTDGPPTAATSFSTWVADYGPELGMRYASELERHFR